MLCVAVDAWQPSTVDVHPGLSNRRGTGLPGRVSRAQAWSMTVNAREVDLSDIEFWARPPRERSAAFRALRQELVLPYYAEPDMELDWIEAGPGYWAVLRHADIEEVSRQPEVFSSA